MGTKIQACRKPPQIMRLPSQRRCAAVRLRHSPTTRFDKVDATGLGCDAVTATYASGPSRRSSDWALPVVSVLGGYQSINEMQHRIARFNWYDLQKTVRGIKNLNFHVSAQLLCFGYC